eukprot:3484118-Rhodomonas_salina.2
MSSAGGQSPSNPRPCYFAAPAPRTRQFSLVQRVCILVGVWRGSGVSLVRLHKAVCSERHEVSRLNVALLMTMYDCCKTPRLPCVKTNYTFMDLPRLSGREF